MKAHQDWKIFLKPEIEKDYYLSLVKFLKEEEAKNKIIFPKKENWFNALSTSPKNIKVIIIGQDPYYGDNQAHGFSFSVQKGIRPPPSLMNIYKEIENEFKIAMNKNNGDLTPWVEQGVLLLNSILTVEKGMPASHKNRGWEEFTDQIIKTLSDNFENKVFLLWGKFAQSKENLINNKKHLILKSAHPSPHAADNGFFGNNHFIATNNYLEKNKFTPIDWKII